jgi:tetratricopeptide (TPR) repeat protein
MIGSDDGTDLYAFDDDGTQLALLPLGPGTENRMLALVQPRGRTDNIYVYFGSGARAPVHKRAFLPGLTCDVRTLPDGPSGNWDQVAALLQKSKSLGKVFVDTIELASNPVDSSEACLLVFDGYLKIDKPGAYTYMIVTDDAGYLFIDDDLLIERNGRHWARDAVRGEFRKEVQLEAGAHRIRLVVVDFGGDLMGVVARWISGTNKHVLRPDEFLQPGKTALKTVEARYDDAPMPAFWYRLKSYMSVGEQSFTEVEVGTYNQREATWEFEDGARLQGATVRRVIAGLSTVGVRATQQRTRAQGVIAFPEEPPPQWNVGNDTQLKHYTALILKQNLDDIEPTVLWQYVTLLEFRELNEDTVPLCEAILERDRVKNDLRKSALLQLARAGARSFPDKADEAYKELLSDNPGKGEWSKIAREYGEFLIFRKRDFETADKLIGHIEHYGERNSNVPLELRMEVKLQKGDGDGAREFLSNLLSGKEFGEKQRYAVVQGNALRERFYDLLAAGFILDAWAVMHEWADTSPVDFSNGNLALARARLWQRLGWLDGALGELDGAMLLDPLLPNLPDVELERGRTLKMAGETKRANEVFLKIVHEYPNHPVADQAKEMVQ